MFFSFVRFILVFFLRVDENTKHEKKLFITLIWCENNNSFFFLLFIFHFSLFFFHYYYYYFVNECVRSRVRPGIWGLRVDLTRVWSICRGPGEIDRCSTTTWRYLGYIIDRRVTYITLYYYFLFIFHLLFLIQSLCSCRKSDITFCRTYMCIHNHVKIHFIDTYWKT